MSWERAEEIAAFEAAENYINEIPKFTAKNAMEDTQAFLHRLGDPDEKMRIIHVAGTNGKGSVCAYLCSILRAAGYSVALFTSPHLVDIRERFAVDGELISRADFLRIFRKIYGMLDRSAQGEKGAYHPSYFEFLFFMAMVYFAERKPDFCILETGLGGRLDATNSVRRKELAVITHMGLDHVEYLGDTVEKIAGEKAGILQAGAEAVFWDTCPETTAVFERRASELGIIAQSVSEKDISFSNFNGKSIDFSLRTGYYGVRNVHGGEGVHGRSNIHGGKDVHGCIDLALQTIAAYQAENCALAVRGIEALQAVFWACGRPVTEEHIRKGAWDCFWAGRMEEVLPGVYVDGAHNEDGIRAFLESVSADGHEGGRSLLFGVARDKDYEHMMERLIASGLFGRIAAAPMGNVRGLDSEGLEALMRKYPDCRFRVHEDVASALRALLQEREGERIYIAGSLYLVGEIKELIGDDKF